MSQALCSRFLDLRALAALEHMRFTTRHRIDGAYSGRHRSRQQGGAGEFVEYREYTGGEDLRRVDWKVFGRTGKAFVRLHQDETNLRCMVAIDASGSMAFRGGDRAGSSKLEYAQFLATALSHLIGRSQDQVGLAVLGEGLRQVLAPGSTLPHIRLVQGEVEQLRSEPARRMAPALNQLFERSNRRGVLMLISDFLMDDVQELIAALRLFRHRGWEVIALHLVHPDEERLPAGTAFRFEGMEAEGAVACCPAEIRAAYEQQFETHLKIVRQLALAIGVDYRLVSTAVPYLQTLQGLLVERAG